MIDKMEKSNVEKKKTPIAIFTYNRPEHTQRVLRSISRCERLGECDLYIYCDGAKRPEHETMVNESRKIVHEWALKLDANVIIREKNMGLARSIVDGVTDLCNRYGRIIVVEDDLLLDRGFIDYMLQALDTYDREESVYQIAGFMYPIDDPRIPDSFFLPFMSSWGWGTWDRAWSIYDWSAAGWEEELSNKRVRRRFDLNNSIGFYSLLKSTLNGQIDTWDILWYYQIFKRNGVVLYPRRTMVWNVGFDGSGTNCGSTPVYQAGLNGFNNKPFIKQQIFPEKVAVDKYAFNRVQKYFRSIRPSIFSRLACRLRSLLRKT